MPYLFRFQMKEDVSKLIQPHDRKGGKEKEAGGIIRTKKQKKEEESLLTFSQGTCPYTMILE